MDGGLFVVVVAENVAGILGCLGHLGDGRGNLADGQRRVAGEPVARGAGIGLVVLGAVDVGRDGGADGARGGSNATDGSERGNGLDKHGNERVLENAVIQCFSWGKLICIGLIFVRGDQAQYL